jgi:hypothetical protein
MFYEWLSLKTMIIKSFKMIRFVTVLEMIDWYVDGCDMTLC